jgi:AcrR family transcriptional regulator
MENTFLFDHANAEKILEEGWNLFQQRGYRGVTIDELCRRCGITKPTLYYYFQDKENLFVQVLQYKLHGFREAIEKPDTLFESLVSIAAKILISFQSEYSTLLHDREHIKNPENLKKIRDAFHGELFGPLISLMKSGMDSNELKEDNPETFTLIFLGVINNFIGKADELKLENDALARMLTGYFLEGVKKV